VVAVWIQNFVMELGAGTVERCGTGVKVCMISWLSACYVVVLSNGFCAHGSAWIAHWVFLKQIYNEKFVQFIGVDIRRTWSLLFRQVRTS
jgi:hypothetical protein